MIHRDIKGQNVLLTENAEIKLGKTAHRVFAKQYMYVTGDVLFFLVYPLFISLTTDALSTEREFNEQLYSHQTVSMNSIHHCV